MSSKNKNCTFNQTGSAFQPQYYRECYTCFGPTEGACLSCIEKCHRGHAIGPMKYGSFFCDCGEKGPCSDKLPTLPMDLDPGMEPVTFTPFNPPGLTNTSKLSVEHCQALRTFASKMFRLVDKSLVFSPLNIHMVMSLIHQGSIKQVDQELTTALCHKLTMEDISAAFQMWNAPPVSMANIILVNGARCSLQKDYHDQVAPISFIGTRDFSDNSGVAKEINDFVSANTKGMIPEIINPGMVSSDTATIIAGTIYFKSNWKKSFDASYTKKMPFINPTGSTKLVDMMNTCKTFNYFENNDVQLCHLPYVDKDYAMIVCVNKPSAKNAGSKNLCMETIMSMPNTRSYKVTLAMPKFTQRSNMSLVPVFKQMGAGAMFGFSDNFSKMLSSTERVAIDKIIHEAVVIVDEVGTEASAATVVMMCLESCRGPKPHAVMELDKPFAYCIWHYPTNTPLFCSWFDGTN